jgi:molybdopterin synthase sulfur carrier subunit
MPKVSLPSVLGERTHECHVEVTASTLKEAIEQLESKYPGFRDDLCSANGGVRPSLTVMIDGRSVRSLDHPLHDNSEIDITSPMAGG